MIFMREIVRRYPGVTFGVIFLVAFSLSQGSLGGSYLCPVAYAAQTPDAQDIDGLMNKLLDSALSEAEKERIAAVVFFHTDTYRSSVLHGHFAPDSPQVQAFLKYKQKLHIDVIQRMGITYKNRFGTPLTQPIIPFSYNNIFSDDDIITGTGKTGRLLEELFNESLSDIIQERAGRPMTAADRQRIDVNGLAWNMTQEGAFEDFRHKEKYINPQSGYANQQKLIEGARKNKVTAYTFDKQGRVVPMSAAETINAIGRLEVDRPLEIPGIDVQKGTGSMSDFLRMAEMHQVKFPPGAVVTDGDIIQFIRNQKYSQRVIDPFREIGAAVDPDLARQYDNFMRVSDTLRDQTSVRGVAQVLQAEYNIKILDPNGIIDFNRLGEAMKIHQTLQLTEALPRMMGSVAKSEVFKISEWLKSAKAGDRLTLRKQMALTYAPLTDGQRGIILGQIDKIDLPDPDKAFVRQALDGDARQIRRYAELLEIPAGELAARLKINGDNMAVVDFVIGKNAKVKALTDAIGSRPGGSRFNDFLKSKTARALNLDVMLDFSGENKGQKFMQWSMILLACTRAYAGAPDEKEGLKQMGTAVFSMIPFVASALRFSEGEYREAFKEFAMDIFPPMALANLAFMALDYTAKEVKAGWDETVWDGLVREALRDLSDNDFLKTDMGYYQIKDRESYFEYIKEIAPGMGRVAKLAAMVEPEVEALMSRNEEVKTNLAALHALQWFEAFDEQKQSVYWAKQFDIEQLKNRVWDQGPLAKGAASPVERVAAKILLDNMAIRLEMQNRVLSRFIDRIEQRYNDLKGEVTGDCSGPGIIGGALEMIMGPDSEECDPNAIVMETMAILKSLYENAPVIVRESPWGLETLEGEYVSILGYLKDYSPRGKSHLAIRKEMQEIITGFKAFIDDLVFGVALYEEARTLDLALYLYGGDNEYHETKELLMGDSFRLGISARVSPRHKDNRNWQVFYYVAGPEDVFVNLIGNVRLSANKYNPGTTGLWLIENPDKGTIFQIRKGDIAGKFDQEGVYQFMAVFAFGSWSDPIGEVGYAALRNPIENAQVFKPDRVAFASPALDVIVNKAVLSARSKKAFYQSREIPEIVFSLSVPEYAKIKKVQADCSATAAADNIKPECYPAKLDSISFDDAMPSLFNVVIPPVVGDGQYWVDIKASIEGLSTEFQPYSQTVFFDYVKGEEDTEEDTVNLEEWTTRMSLLEELMSVSQSLYDKVSSTSAILDSEVEDAVKTLNSLEKDLRSIDKMVDAANKKVGAVDNNLALVQKDAYQAQAEAEKAAAFREKTQKHALECCLFADQIRVASDVARLKQLISEVRREDGEAQSFKRDFEASLKIARLAKEEAVQIKDTMSLLRTDRADIMAQVARLGNVLGVVQGDVERLEHLLGIISGVVSESATVRIRAEAVFNEIMAALQIKKIAKTLTSEDKAFEKKASGLVRAISNNDINSANFEKRGKGKTGKPVSQLANSEKEYLRIAQSVEALSVLPQVSDEIFSEFEKSAKDAQVAYDSAEIFEDSVNLSAQQSAACLSASEKHYAVETSPQTQVAKKDCSPWPGSSAKWDPKKEQAECHCASGHLWDKDKNRCVTKREYEWDRASCDHAVGTSKSWNASKQKVECACPSGQVWVGARNRCEASQSNQGGMSREGAQELLKGLQGLMKAATGGGSGSAGSGGAAGQQGSSGQGGDFGGCAPPGKYDPTCSTYCRCPNGDCEYFGQGCGR